MGDELVDERGQVAARAVLADDGAVALGVEAMEGEDVVEDEVSGRLLSKNEGLNKFLKLGGLVGGFTNDLDDDIVV